MYFPPHHPDKIVPLFVVLLVGLSQVVDEHRLLNTVASNLHPLSSRSRSSTFRPGGGR
jgi:hypothetical protein